MHQKIRGDRDKAAEKFSSGERPYMIYQTPETGIYNNMRTPEECFAANIEYIQKAISIPSDEWTDTQSASDTATLVLDASGVFIGCMLEPEVMMDFMKGINELIIKFSQLQVELIGDALVKPGHIMVSNKCMVCIRCKRDSTLTHNGYGG